MFGLGASELIILLVIILIIFGPGKLPEVGRSIGRGIREFKSASERGDEESENSQEQENPDAEQRKEDEKN